jgi:hypothetical protein
MKKNDLKQCLFSDEPVLSSPLVTKCPVCHTPKKPVMLEEGAQRCDQVLAAVLETDCHPENGRSPLRIRHPDNINSRQRELHSNCNDWYRHEHTIIVADDVSDDDEKKENRQRHSSRRRQGPSTPSWWPSEGDSPVESPKRRLMREEGESYRRRNYAGSVNEWYPHEHSSRLVLAEHGEEQAHECYVCGKAGIGEIDPPSQM